MRPNFFSLRSPDTAGATFAKFATFTARRTDVCVQHTVVFANDDAVPVRVSWTPDTAAAAEPASVWVTPETFDVPGRAATRVRIRVEPIRAGTVRRALRFRAERRVDGAGDTAAAAAMAVVYVRGAVEPSLAARVQPTAAVVAPGPACAGVPLSYGVRLRPYRATVGDGPFRVRGAQYELDAAGTLRPRPGAVGDNYGPYDAGDAADLHFPVPVGTEVSGGERAFENVYSFVFSNPFPLVSPTRLSDPNRAVTIIIRAINTASEMTCKRKRLGRQRLFRGVAEHAHSVVPRPKSRSRAQRPCNGVYQWRI